MSPSLYKYYRCIPYTCRSKSTYACWRRWVVALSRHKMFLVQGTLQAVCDYTSILLRRPRHSDISYQVLFKELYGAHSSYSAVRCGLTEPHRPYDFSSNKTAPHRTAPQEKKRTAPHRRIWWQSVEQAFLSVRIELIRRKKTPRTVSSNLCHPCQMSRFIRRIRQRIAELVQSW